MLKSWHHKVAHGKGVIEIVHTVTVDNDSSQCFSKCRTSHELTGMGGSIAGCVSITAGMGVCIIQPTTVHMDGVKRWGHGADVCAIAVGA